VRERARGGARPDGESLAPVAQGFAARARLSRSPRLTASPRDHRQAEHDFSRADEPASQAPGETAVDNLGRLLGMIANPAQSMRTGSMFRSRARSY